MRDVHKMLLFIASIVLGVSEASFMADVVAERELAATISGYHVLCFSDYHCGDPGSLEGKESHFTYNAPVDGTCVTNHVDEWGDWSYKITKSSTNIFTEKAYDGSSDCSGTPTSEYSYTTGECFMDAWDTACWIVECGDQYASLPKHADFAADCSTMDGTKCRSWLGDRMGEYHRGDGSGANRDDIMCAQVPLNCYWEACEEYSAGSQDYDCCALDNDARCADGYIYQGKYNDVVASHVIDWIEAPGGVGGRCQFGYMYRGTTCCSLDPAYTTNPVDGHGHECSQEYCTSPDTSGGHDCWAGSTNEPCSCSSGKTAHVTGAETEYEGKTYYEYTCCDDDSGDGEQCGDYRHPWWLFIILFFIIGCCCWGCCHCYNRAQGSKLKQPQVQIAGPSRQAVQMTQMRPQQVQTVQANAGAGYPVAVVASAPVYQGQGAPPGYSMVQPAPQGEGYAMQPQQGYAMQPQQGYAMQPQQGYAMAQAHPLPIAALPIGPETVKIKVPGYGGGGSVMIEYNGQMISLPVPKDAAAGEEIDVEVPEMYRKNRGGGMPGAQAPPAYGSEMQYTYNN